MKKINIKLSITTMFFLSIVGIVNINCSDDVLEQVNPNVITPSGFWKTPEDAKKGIIGAYAPFTNIWYYTRFEIFTSDYRDDLVNGFNVSERTAVGRFGGTPGANGTIWVWRAMFQGVNRANEVIFHVPNIDMNATDRDNIVGEGYFIRGFNYFNLLNNWLNVPLITSPISEIEKPSEILQAPPADVWAQVEADLKQAQQLLPASWPDSELGRVTSGAATGMLGKVYLYQGKYAEAKAEFSKIMNSSYELMDNYAHNFTEEFENNKESLFEIQFTADGINGWGADNANSRKAAAYTMDLAPKGFTGQDGFRINNWALDLFLDERTINNEIDPRAYTTLFWDNDETTTYEGNVLASRTYENKTWDEAYPSGDTNVYANKFLDWEYKGFSAASFNNSGNNFRVLRYADVLLMYAEAEFMLNGSTQSALDAINEVRERVDMPAFTTITMQEIEEERIKELSLEKTRYYDLLRWDKVKSRIVDNSEFKSESGGTSAYQEGREYIAIPQNELDRNLNFKQNPGY
ncbi:putative outer membrane starch-binding protein [Maribacter vaceletii]|uniref:Putative outer membrane starch-binding protein n=1 Tax=Maribacter vaceletii TaxID=1206816 RepID=A0A495EBW5_9FLAO|nr:RagB/SusD family nutrient uptake outer membrane protein [Maribacter vaceletii]RKR14374.1 putative outer membrane starch-binding protein [Maribacter vaceletii]